MDWLSIASIRDESIYKKVTITCMYQSIFRQTEVNIGLTHRALIAANMA